MGELVKPLNCKFNSIWNCKFKSCPFHFKSRMFLQNYFSIFIFFALSVVLSAIIFLLSFAVSAKLDDTEKLTAYECGFNPFDDSISEFDIRFYLIAILFIIFDLELSFLFPFSVAFDSVNFLGFGAMLIFLFILTIGFVYEWKKGALDWD